MRTNIVLDEQLVKDCPEATVLKTKRELVEHALQKLLKTHRQGKIKDYFGKLRWEGNLDEMRTD
jgi:Arc/MetJ family transcription regulator